MNAVAELQDQSQAEETFEETEVILVSNRRRDDRIKVDGLRLDIFPKNHPVIGKVQGRIENLSTGGLLFSVNQPFEDEPSRLFVSFPLPTGDMISYARARVAHVFPFKGRQAYGLAFFPLTPKNKDRIQTFLSSLENQI